jgi:hypothetical protein
VEKTRKNHNKLIGFVIKCTFGILWKSRTLKIPTYSKYRKAQNLRRKLKWWMSFQLTKYNKNLVWRKVYIFVNDWIFLSQSIWQAYFHRSLGINILIAGYKSSFFRCFLTSSENFSVKLKKLARGLVTSPGHRSWSHFLKSWIIIRNSIFTWKYSEILTKMPPPGSKSWDHKLSNRLRTDVQTKRGQ